MGMASGSFQRVNVILLYYTDLASFLFANTFAHNMSYYDTNYKRSMELMQVQQFGICWLVIFVPYAALFSPLFFRDELIHSMRFIMILEIPSRICYTLHK